jgi:hypothetical protein
MWDEMEQRQTSVLTVYAKAYQFQTSYSNELHIKGYNVHKAIYVVEITNTMHWLYHSFILYTGSYMFRQ